MEKVLQTWLDHQCRMLTGSIHAVLLTGLPDQGPYDRVLIWPDEGRDPAQLSMVAQEALQAKKSVVRTCRDPIEASDESLDALACPLFAEGRLLGAVAIAMSRLSPAMQRTMLQQIQTGTIWLEAMIALSSAPAAESAKKEKVPDAEKKQTPMQDGSGKRLTPHSQLMLAGSGLVVLLLAVVFLLSSLWRAPSDSKSGAVIRQAIIAPPQRYTIKAQVPSAEAVDAAKTALTQDVPQTEATDAQPQEPDAPPQEPGEAPSEAEQTEAADPPAVTEEKVSTVPETEASQAIAAATQEQPIPNPEDQTAAPPAESFYSVSIGPVIGGQELNEAGKLLHGDGFDFRQTSGTGTVKVTRLLEGLYPRDAAQERFKAVQAVVDSAFVIPERGKLAIYVATYHNPAKANQEIKELAKKDIKVTPVTTELKMKGTILVVDRVDQDHLETIRDRMSHMGFSLKVEAAE